MTLSSIVVRTKSEYLIELIDQLKETDLCDYHMNDGNSKIIITIEGEGIEEEISKLKEIQQFSKIISAEMIYSYSENELDYLKENINNKIPEWMNDPDVKANDIIYKGDLKKKDL